MKRILILLISAACLAALSGCTWLADPVIDEGVARLLSEGTVYAPLVNGLPFSYDTVQPGDQYLLDFSTNRDQYGNRAGLSDDEVWTIDEVTVQLPLKTEADTIFHPNNLGKDKRVVFFGWTAPVDPISGLPYPIYPLEGYPWNSCQTHSIPAMAGQMATVTVVAKADVIEVEFVCPEMGESGSYQLLVVGSTPQGDPAVVRFIDQPGTYRVRWRDDEETREVFWDFVVPPEWFYLRGEWEIPVGPTGTC